MPTISQKFFLSFHFILFPSLFTSIDSFQIKIFNVHVYIHFVVYSFQKGSQSQQAKSKPNEYLKIRNECGMNMSAVYYAYIHAALLHTHTHTMTGCNCNCISVHLTSSHLSCSHLPPPPPPLLSPTSSSNSVANFLCLCGHLPCVCVCLLCVSMSVCVCLSVCAIERSK